MTASPSGLSAALLPTQRTLCGSEPKAFPVGKGTQCPFSAPQEQGSSPAPAFPRQPWLGPARTSPGMEPSWGRAERSPPDLSRPVMCTALSTYLCDTREAAFLDVSFLPGGDFNHCMSALIPPSAPAAPQNRPQSLFSLHLSLLRSFSASLQLISFVFLSFPHFPPSHLLSFSCSSHDP